jgi:hypothetical protein
VTVTASELVAGFNRLLMLVVARAQHACCPNWKEYSQRGATREKGGGSSAAKPGRRRTPGVTTGAGAGVGVGQEVPWPVRGGSNDMASEDMTSTAS